MPYSRLLVAQLAIACTVLALKVPASGASAEDNRVTRFMEAFERLDPQDDKHAVWVGPESPFAPYLSPPFMDGLSERARQLYKRALGLGACLLARRLAIVGFLANHPHLRPVFRHTRVRFAFDLHVWPEHSPCCAQPLLELRSCCAACMPHRKGDIADPILKEPDSQPGQR